MKRRDLTGLAGFLLIFAAAAVLRIAYLCDFASLPVFGQVCGPDVSEYFAEAQKIRAGQWLPQEVMIHAPLYPYWLALNLTLAAGDLFTVRLIQALLCALLTLLPVFLMLRKRTAGLSGPVRLLPYAATLLLGLYPPLAICQCDFFSENLMLILLLFSLWSFTLHRRWADGAAGVFGGLAALAHPGCIFYLPGAVLYSWFRLRTPVRPRLLRTGSLVLGALLVILPVSLRNSLLAGRPVLIQDNSMFNLVLGNSPDSTGTCRLPPGRRWEAEFERAHRGAAEQGISVDAFYRDEFFRYVAGHPLHYGKMLLKKAAMTFSAREFTTWSDVTSLGLIFWHRYLYHDWFLILLLLGGPALLIGLFRRGFRRFMGLELLLFGAVFAGQVFFLTAGRYRMPLVVPLAVFAGYFLCRMRSYLGTPHRAALVIASMIGLFLLACYPYAVARQPERDYARSLMASAYLKAGRPAEAVRMYEQPAAGECFPDRKLSILGRAWHELGDLGRASEYYGESLRRYPRQAEGYLNYATVLSDSGRTADARKVLLAGMRLQPKGRLLADFLYEQGRLAQRDRQYEAAEEYYRKALEVLPSHRKALNNLGTLQMMKHRPDLALPLFERALKLEPDNARLQANLAAALAMSGRESEAREIVTEILRRDPECVPARKLQQALGPGN
ncbi:MAG: tetratricopeptide repeat protein [Lentisphaeria bacterium]|nr:tetratricopeptide repeat protein [Lentisphaeria bacterium]